MPKDIYEEIVDLRAKGIRAALATIIASKGATPRKDMAKMLIREDGQQLGTIGGGSAEAEVRKEAQSIMETGKAKLLTFDLKDIDPEDSALVCGGFMEVYVEPVLPAPTLFIFGAGHVSKALAEAAKPVGFKIAIIDDRVKYANEERFPSADAFYIDEWEHAYSRLPINDSSFLFLATRGHQFDLICLRHAIQSPARYIGVLGSLKKAKILLDLLEKEGTDPSLFKRVCVPAGLDIGSETPEEIAVSIVAELIAVRNKLDIQPLKESLHRMRKESGIRNQHSLRQIPIE
jgi:xanthine dehydrogenase accessory factor